MGDCASEIRLLEEDRTKANQFFLRSLEATLTDGKEEVKRLRRNLSITYYVIVVLSIIMFALGVALLSVPLIRGLREVAAAGQTTEIWQSLVAGGFGLADLVALFLFRPVERIHALMGDMSQITLAVNSYQTQLGLRLLECDANDPATLGVAGEKVNEAAVASIKLIQDYFEAKAQAGR